MDTWYTILSASWGLGSTQIVISHFQTFYYLEASILCAVRHALGKFNQINLEHHSSPPSDLFLSSPSW